MERRAQRVPVEKTSKFGLDEYNVLNEKLTCTYIHEPILIIDCRWHGFGGMRDIFDLICPPTVNKVIVKTFLEDSHNIINNHEKPYKQ